MNICFPLKARAGFETSLKPPCRLCCSVRHCPDIPWQKDWPRLWVYWTFSSWSQILDQNISLPRAPFPPLFHHKIFLHFLTLKAGNLWMKMSFFLPLLSSFIFSQLPWRDQQVLPFPQTKIQKEWPWWGRRCGRHEGLRWVWSCGRWADSRERFHLHLHCLAWYLHCSHMLQQLFLCITLFFLR